MQKRKQAHQGNKANDDHPFGWQWNGNKVRGVKCMLQENDIENSHFNKGLKSTFLVSLLVLLSFLLRGGTHNRCEIIAPREGIVKITQPKKSRTYCNLMENFLNRFLLDYSLS